MLQPPTKSKAVTNLVLAPTAEGKAAGIRVPPKILNPADAARAGAPGEAPAGRPEGGIKQSKRYAQFEKDVAAARAADAKAQQIAQQRQQDLQPSGASSSAAEMTPEERAAAEQQLQRLRQNVGAIGAVASTGGSGTRTPPGRLPVTAGRTPATPGTSNPTTPGGSRRATNRSPNRGDGRRGGGNRGGGDRGGGGGGYDDRNYGRRRG